MHHSKSQHPNAQKIEINPDSLVAYHTKLKTLRKKLDSLDNLHEEINIKLKDLKCRSELIRKEQNKSDLINVSIVIVIVVILIKIIHSKLRSKKQ